MTPEEHQIRHEQLHAALDELSADYVSQTAKLLSKTSIIDLMHWSFNQTQEPSKGFHKVDR